MFEVARPKLWLYGIHHQPAMFALYRKQCCGGITRPLLLRQLKYMRTTGFNTSTRLSTPDPWQRYQIPPISRRTPTAKRFVHLAALTRSYWTPLGANVVDLKSAISRWSKRFLYATGILWGVLGIYSYYKLEQVPNTGRWRLKFHTHTQNLVETSGKGSFVCKRSKNIDSLLTLPKQWR